MYEKKVFVKKNNVQWILKFSKSAERFVEKFEILVNKVNNIYKK